MSPIHCEIVVIGAGVLGLSVAAELTARGHDVLVVDPGRVSASAVAAGMIAPAFESLLDRVDVARAELLRDASSLWPAFADRHGLTLDRSPAEWRGPDAEDVAEAMTRLGYRVSRDDQTVRVDGDHRVEPEAALERIRARLSRAVQIGEATSLERLAGQWRVRTTAGDVEARQVVLATGVAGPLSGLPELVAEQVGGIEPIAGQIGRSRTSLGDRVVRGVGGYLAPNRDTTLIGATMVHGSRDVEPDPEAGERLMQVARRLSGQNVSPEIEWRGGVRGATADGLPLAGPVGGDLHLALAPRRNGWLLGPLVGQIVADGIEGRPRSRYAAALDPLRFSSQAG